MSMNFCINFYIKQPLSRKLVRKIFDCILDNGAGFLIADKKTKANIQIADRCSLSFYNAITDSHEYLPNIENIGEKPLLKDCIELIIKHGNGMSPIVYKNFSFDLYFFSNTYLKDKHGYSMLSLNTSSSSQFTTNENAKQNFRGFMFLADRIWETIKPFFGVCGFEPSNNINKIESGELKDLEDEIFYFSKESIAKIGKNKIFELIWWDFSHLKKFKDESLRVIVYDRAGLRNEKGFNNIDDNEKAGVDSDDSNL